MGLTQAGDEWGQIQQTGHADTQQNRPGQQDQLRATPIRSAGSLRNSSQPRHLFLDGALFAVAAQGFVMVKPIRGTAMGAADMSGDLILVQNWGDELQASHFRAVANLPFRATGTASGTP